MVTGCKNCGGFFTVDEMARLRTPMHMWRLTAIGERIAQENATQGGDQRPCPTCGHKTLRSSNASSMTSR